MFIYQGGIIANFLNQNATQFKIPVYQRNYEWSLEQCIKLFDDIVAAAKRNKPHFCGSIVFLPIAPIKGISNNVIIDGQQRLTTIYILMKALADCAENESEKSLPYTALFNTDQYNQYQLDETSKLKLKPAKEDNEQLLALIYDDRDHLDPQRKISQNYDAFCNMIRKQQTEGVSVADIYRGISLLTVAVIQLDFNDNAQELFERINSTGVRLELEDLIRNYVLMTDDQQDMLYDSYWLKIEKMLGDDMASFFMDYLILKSSELINEKNAYDTFKHIFKAEGFSNESMLKELLHYANYYHAFLHGDAHYSQDVNDALESLRSLKQTTVYLFLFRVFDDYHKGIIDQDELAKVMKFLVNYSIRRMICEVGSNTLRGLYRTLHYRVFRKEENKKHYYDAIYSFFRQQTTKDVLISDEQFRTALIYNNLYRKNALCRYLLIHLENHGKAKVYVDNMSIEHIMPQSKNLSVSWQEMLGADWQSVQEKYLHTLGNLSLTAYNSEIGDKPFDKKKEMYAPEEAKISYLFKTIRDVAVWNAAAIEARGNALADDVLKFFAIEQPQHSIYFNDPGYQEYTCEDPDIATNKSPNYYVFEGERVVVSTFSELYRSMILRLYRKNSSIIESMAKNKEKIFSSGTKILFSYDPADTVDEWMIGDTGIYQNSNYSSYQIILIIRKLLDRYDLDHDVFSYSAK